VKSENEVNELVKTSYGAAQEDLGSCTYAAHW